MVKFSHIGSLSCFFCLVQSCYLCLSFVVSSAVEFCFRQDPMVNQSIETQIIGLKKEIGELHNPPYHLGHCYNAGICKQQNHHKRKEEIKKRENQFSLSNMNMLWRKLRILTLGIWRISLLLMPTSSYDKLDTISISLFERSLHREEKNTSHRSEIVDSRIKGCSQIILYFHWKSFWNFIWI